MASQLALSEMVSHAAGVGCRRSEYAFLKAYEAVHELEYRPRRVWRLHCSVEHRLVWIGEDLVVVLSEVSKHVHVDARA